MSDQPPEWVQVPAVTRVAAGDAEAVGVGGELRQDRGGRRACASVEGEGWRARSERPPAGVCVEDARAILCRGGRGQTVAECSPPAIRSSFFVTGISFGTFNIAVTF